MREKRSYAQEVCVKSAGKAMQQTGMIWPGCRIGVAVSGGVDSFVLLKTLHIRQCIVPFRFEIMAIHLNPGFDPQSHMPLAAWLSQHGIPSHLEVTDFGTPIRPRTSAVLPVSAAPGCAANACSSSVRGTSSPIWPWGTMPRILSPPFS